MTRRALLIATNYPGTPYALRGCVNDALDLQDLAGSRMYQTTTVLDDDATRATVLPLLRDFVSRTKYGDRLLISYSGHGTHVADRSGDETDNRDEAICLADFQRTGVTGDDEINAILSQRAYGSRVTFLADSCHSGSVTRLIGSTWTPRFIDGTDLERAAPPVKRRALSRDPGVLISGCADHEVSYDATFNGRPNGAMTYAALKTWLPDSTYAVWHKRLSTELLAGFPQHSQMDATWAQRRWIAID